MTTGLTARQTQILKSIIDEYIESASPVGSSSLEKKYNLGVSPATIRAEMAELTKMKYLKQPHTSAGRAPTPLGMKFYINQLMEERQLGIAEEVKAKEEVWDVRNDFDKFINEATQALADRTKSLAVTATDDGRLYKAGMKNIFDNPEFYDLQVCHDIFESLEEVSRIHELFFERLTGMHPVEVLFGLELAWPSFEDVGIIAKRFDIHGKKGAIGVMTAYRRAPSVIPAVRFMGNLIEELLI